MAMLRSFALRGQRRLSNERVDEYRRLCPYVDEIEGDWGAAPGAINSFGDELLIQGLQLGNVFIGVQPTFGYEGDPMRLMMARSGCAASRLHGLLHLSLAGLEC